MTDLSLSQSAADDQFGSMRASILEFVSSLPKSVAPTCGDLIVGFATGYQPHMIAPFVESVRMHGKFTGKIVLFVDPDARKLAEYLNTHDIEAVAFHPSKSPVNSLVMGRFFAYFDYLQEQWNSGAVFDQILLTDVRDVIFQSPLFRTRCDELEFHLEEPSLTIGGDRFTSQWVEMACGEQALQALSSRTVSCAGTVSGRTIGIFDYLAQMQLLALGLSDAVRSTTWGVDQALHNYILYMNLTRSAVIKPNFARVATLGVVQGSSLTCDEKGRIIDRTGQVSEIVHQWDRHRHLAKYVCAVYLRDERYGRWRVRMARTLPVLTLSSWSHLLRLVRIGFSRGGLG